MISEIHTALNIGEKLWKFIGFLGKIKTPQAESVSSRFVRLFECHNVHRNQIPRFFGHGLTVKDVHDDQSLLCKLDESLLEAACERFGVRREWLDGAESEIYSCHDFYKHPEDVLPFLNKLRESNQEGELDGMLIAPEACARSDAGTGLRAIANGPSDADIGGYPNRSPPGQHRDQGRMAAPGIGRLRRLVERLAAMIRVDALWLSTRPLDMLAGTETILAQVVRIFGEAQPHHAYLFANRRGTRLKVLVHDGYGVWLANRRLNQGRFQLRAGDGRTGLTRGQFDALVLGLPWERLADGGVIRVL